MAFWVLNDTTLMVRGWCKMNNNVREIYSKIESMMHEIGFKEEIVNHYKAGKTNKNYVRGTMYCLPVFVETLGFIVEYADSLHDAQLYMYDDGDCFPLELGEAAILEGIRKELQEAISDMDKPQALIVPDMQVAV